MSYSLQGVPQASAQKTSPYNLSEERLGKQALSITAITRGTCTLLDSDYSERRLSFKPSLHRITRSMTLLSLKNDTNLTSLIDGLLVGGIEA